MIATTPGFAQALHRPYNPRHAARDNDMATNATLHGVLLARCLALWFPKHQIQHQIQPAGTLACVA